MNYFISKNTSNFVIKNQKQAYFRISRATNKFAVISRVTKCYGPIPPTSPTPHPFRSGLFCSATAPNAATNAGGQQWNLNIMLA